MFDFWEEAKASLQTFVRVLPGVEPFGLRPAMKARLVNLIVGLTILLAAGWAGPGARGAPVGTLERATQMYRAGNFLEAAALARRPGTAAGLTLAARATLAQGAYRSNPGECEELFKQAEGLARRAMGMDPKNGEAVRMLVIALGYIARRTSPLSAFFQGYAGKARKLIDHAMELDPRSPWGYSLLGAWHTEIVHNAGAGLAAGLYDASASSARDNYEKAVAGAPENPVIHFEYAKALVTLDMAKQKAKIRHLLSLAGKHAPRDAVETLIAAKARRAIIVLDGGKVEALLKLLYAGERPDGK